VNDKDNLIFLEEDELKKRENILYALIWTRYYYNLNEKLAPVKIKKMGDLWTALDSKHDNWSQNEKEDEKVVTFLKKLGKLNVINDIGKFVIKELFKLDYNEKNLFIRKRVKVNKKYFIPTIFAVKGEKKLWIEQGEPDKEKLNFLSRNFDGRIICFSNLRWLTHDIVDINYWEVDFYLPKGIEFWHLEENLPTGWGVIRDHKGRLIFIENKSLKKRPTKVYNNIWAQLILSQTKKSPFKYLKYGLNRYYATTAKEE